MATDPLPPYTVRRVQELLGVTRATLAQLVDAGLVTPARGPRNEHRFSYQDLVLIRTAQGLHAARIPPRRIAESLRRVRARLPAEMPLSGIRVSVQGRDVVVREGTGRWEATTGQGLLEFHVEATGTEVVFLPVGAAAPATRDSGGPGDTGDDATAPTDTDTDTDTDTGHGGDDASTWFAHAARLEPTDPAGAEAAYRQALRRDPRYADAWLDLGALLCERGRCAEAAALYDEAVARCPDEPLLWFNRGIALEDLQRDAEAAESYERCLALSPGERDAHFNAARLYERLGDGRRALRHLNAYRRSGG